MDKILNVKGLKKKVIFDSIITNGFYKVSNRSSVRHNLKSYHILPIKSDSKENIGIKFKKLSNMCLVHFDVPEGTNFQLIISDEIDIKNIKKTVGLDKQYIGIIEKAYNICISKPSGKIKK